MNKTDVRRKEQLSMSYGKANNILKKSILFYLAKECNKDICYRCGNKIDTIDEFSIDHKENWLDSENPKKLFFDLDNVAFSHNYCNTTNRRIKIGKTIVHGTTTGYRYGCRCKECTESKTIEKRCWVKAKRNLNMESFA